MGLICTVPDNVQYNNAKDKSAEGLPPGAQAGARMRMQRHYANPLPAWVSIIQPDPEIDTGIMGCSDGINILNHNTILRHRKGNFETDGAKWGAPLSKGKHVFEIHWPMGMRGLLATVGVGSEEAPLFVKPRDSLVGCNSRSWGLDIVRRRVIHNKQLQPQAMPRAGFVPDKMYMYVDCDSGTVGFGSEVDYYGAPHNIPKHAFPVYAMVGVCHPQAQVTIIYRGSENRNLAGKPAPVNSVPVASMAPGQQVHVTVINPVVVQTKHPGPGPSTELNPPPISQPAGQPHVEMPPPYDETPKPQEEQQAEPQQQQQAEPQQLQVEPQQEQAEAQPEQQAEPKPEEQEQKQPV